MKKSTIFNMISLALVCSAFAACDNESSDLSWGSIASKSIRVSKASSADVVTKSPEEPLVETSEISLADGSVLTLEKTVMPYTAEFETKASEITTDNLDEFVLYGWLEKDDLEGRVAADPTDLTDQNFIKGSPYAGSNDRGWSTNDENLWRNMVKHYFWAQSGLGKMTTTENSASFTYDPKDSSDEADVVVAYTIKDAQEHSGPDADAAIDQIDLTFKHALAAVKVKLDNANITAKQVGNIDIQQGRTIDVESSQIAYLTSGNCDVDADLNFTWKDQSSKSAHDFNLDGSDVFFAVPQSGANITLNIIDSWTGAQFPATITVDDTWASGMMYKYSLKGSVTVPYVNEKPSDPALDLSFKGQGWGNKLVSNLNAKIYKELKVTWENVPTTTSNKVQYALIYFAKEPYTPTQTHGQAPIEEIKSALTANGSLAFLYSTAGDGNPASANPGNVIGNTCSFTYDMSKLDGTVNMYVAAFLSNGGNVSFAPQNFKVEVTEYK